MSDRIYVGPPGLTLANGRPLDYGEELSLTDEQENDNAGLIGAGHLPERTEPQPLAGELLKRRAADLGIEGRGSMTADALRDAVAAAEGGHTDGEEDQ